MYFSPGCGQSPTFLPILWAMARTPKNHAAAAELGKHLTALKARYEARHGAVSYERIARHIEFDLGVAMSAEHVRKYHQGDNDPYAMNPVELAAFANFYGVPPAKLGKTAGVLVERAREVLSRSFGWVTGSQLVA